VLLASSFPVYGKLMDRLEAMALLIESIECGSMSAAGRKLDMPVPTLSRKLSELEAYLGVRLLKRSTRRLELTEAGTHYVAASRRILEQVSEAEREATGEYLLPRGELVLTAPLSFGRRHVLPIVTSFLAQYPEITVRLGLSDQHLDLVGEQVDLAIRIGGLTDSQLIARAIGDMRWVIVASPAFLAAHGTPEEPRELVDRPCVGVDFINLATSWRFREPGTATNYTLPIRSRFAVTNGEGAVDAAVGGVGFTQVLLYQAAPAIAAGQLQVVLQRFEASPLPASIVYTGRGRMPLKARSFLDFSARRLSSDIAKLNASLGPTIEKAAQDTS
jgi:DNA-binding transcriptional LysR family regulator